MGLKKSREQFEEEIRRAINESAKLHIPCGSIEERIRAGQHPVEIAKFLIHDTNAHNKSGFKAAIKKNRTDLTLEAKIIKFKDTGLFDKKDIERAEANITTAELLKK